MANEKGYFKVPLPASHDSLMSQGLLRFCRTCGDDLRQITSEKCNSSSNDNKRKQGCVAL